MLSLQPFIETTASDEIFSHTAEAFAIRSGDYLGTNPHDINPYVATTELRLIVDAEDEKQDEGEAPTEINNAIAMLKSTVPYTEDFQIRYGCDYDFQEDDPRYGKTSLLRHFIELTVSTPVLFDCVRPDERAKAIGTIILEYQTEMSEFLNDAGIDLQDEDVYDIARKYPKQTGAACIKLMRTAEDFVELREVQTLGFELSERERVIRRIFTRSFDIGDSTTILSSLAMDTSGMCEEDSATPFDSSRGSETSEHDEALGDLFAEILSGAWGEDTAKVDQTYQYASGIWELLLMSYAPLQNLAVKHLDL